MATNTQAFERTDRALADTFNEKLVDPVNTMVVEHNAHIDDHDSHVTAEKQAAWDNLKTFQTAGGTATAITITGVELVGGFQLTFVVLSSNNGAATTINTKPLYKPGTTAAPKLTAGKAATVWYNLAGDCFFIKASAEGTAAAGDVLAGTTFSNDDDTGISGTLALTGDALASDVVIGKTFYNTDAKTKLTGTFSNIKSIQRGSLSFSTLTTNIPISEIDVNKSVILIEYPGASGTNNYDTYIDVQGKITSPTQLTLTKGTADIYTNVLNWIIIEFNNVKSLQKGDLSTSGTTPITATITAVDMGKSLVFNSHTSGAASMSQQIKTSCVLTNETTLTFKQGSTGARANHWQVIEFN